MLYSYQQTGGTTVKPSIGAQSSAPEISPKNSNTSQGSKPDDNSQADGSKSPENPSSKLEDAPAPPEEPENPETEDLKSALKPKEILHTLNDIIYNPGPFSSVNKTAASTPVKYLPGFLKSSTMAEVWKPQNGANLKW